MSPATETPGTRPLGSRADGDEPELPRREPLTGQHRQLERRLEDLVGGVAIAFSASGDDFCAQVVAERGTELTAAWARLAARNPGVRRVLERLLSGGEWGEVVFATLPIVVLIGWHHGLVPEGVGARVAIAYGLVPPQGEPAGDPSAPYVPPSEAAPDASGDEPEPEPGD